MQDWSAKTCTLTFAKAALRGGSCAGALFGLPLASAQELSGAVGKAAFCALSCCDPSPSKGADEQPGQLGCFI